ncbi:uncharacterized protein LOC129945107 [Eupeodes corollae]|uniref:uncharacterized protein LOC129945107 n=1 Tax=Eupeodes corollae TaxID=290404 RepID=UPI002490F9CB|nr:uncharacterized protein LOC129945107 [Eupeodes corollae]
MLFGWNKLICFTVLFGILKLIPSIKAANKVGHGRSLIFPPTTPTRLQFICGIGIPVEDLHYESITSGYVLKAEYFLPTNATQLHPDYLKPQTIHRRSILEENDDFLEDDTNKVTEVDQHFDFASTKNPFRSKPNDLSTYRWTIYKALETLGDRMGLVGRACMLKSICESASAPFHHASGILAEIAHIIMTPSSSKDELNHYSNNEYLHAEMLGHSGAACSRLFTECQQSLLEQFSTVFTYSRNALKELLYLKKYHHCALFIQVSKKGKMNLKLFCIIVLLQTTNIISSLGLMHMQSKRFVPPIVFLPTAPTRVQLIFGVGIPEEDLDFESLTNGWVLKYEYFLPSNATQLYVPDRLNIAGRSIPDKVEKYNVEAVEIAYGLDDNDLDSDIDEVRTDFDELYEIRKREQKHLSNYRWVIYKALEAAMDRKGLSGRTCVLRSICEASSLPFYYQNGIFADLIHIILVPSSSVDKLSSHSDNEYFQAEVLGKSGAPCSVVFKDCKLSLLDIFTNILDIQM